MTAFAKPNRDASQMVWVRAPISGASWQVHREVAPLLSWVVAEAERRGYPFHRPGQVHDDWGWNVRKIAGSSTWSNHSGGVAVDIDATQYPQGQRRRVPPAWLIALFGEWGWSWGGGWSRADPMHFEFTRSVEDARRLVGMLAASHIQNVPVPSPPGTPPPAPQPPPTPNSLEGTPDMILTDISTGAVWAVSATHMHHLTPDQFAVRSEVERVTPFPVQPLFILALANGGRQVI